MFGKRYSKYGNVKAEIDGHVFDSMAEARRYNELVLLQKAGEISELQLQPKFLLQGKFYKGNKTYAAIHYIADFMYRRKDGKMVVEDVKGVETDVFKLKKKLFLYKYPEYVFEIV